MIVFPNCKINLGLHVLRKREDNFHDLETIFYPVPLHDALEVITGDNLNEFSLTTSGLSITTDANGNFCSKAYQLLKKDFNLPPVKAHLHKVIPIGAGLGGGSANAAFMLLLLNKNFNLQLTEAQLFDYALQLGSDCPFFINNKPCYAIGRGEKLEAVNLDLSSFKIVLVYPGLSINTKWAFTQIKPNEKSESLKGIGSAPFQSWKHLLHNDFEEPIFAAYPEIKQLKEELYNKGATYASMTGSGSAVYALFEKNILPEFNFADRYFVKIILPKKADSVNPAAE
ncbi:MAG: 4-(cytidine 5'-diphospho)-2-C-methyl-D-erythritol kinase [Chitinophagaceae bacterium]